MNMTPDSELLCKYATSRSEEAFSELVRRHINLVYSAALRQSNGDAHLAEDVAQNVFTDLARKAASLSRRESLTGWLYTSAHFAAAKIARTESRRRGREEKFMREPSNDTSPDADWEKLRPALDSAMHELKETDREAVLLRYFENRPFAEVGAKLCLSEIAARKRVERAVEKLRALLARRGITTGVAMESVISANAVQTAPPSLAGSVTSSALGGAGTGSFTLSKIMNTLLKLGVGALVTTGAIVALLAQHQSQDALRAENQSLAAQLAQLKADNADLSNKVAATGDSRSMTNDQLAELLKLRSEVTQLRAIKTVPIAATAPAVTNSPAKKPYQIDVKVRFVAIPAEGSPAIDATWAQIASNGGPFSDQQIELVDKALDQAAGAQLIGSPQVVTLSGRESVVSVTAPAPASINGTNADVGVSLDVTPFYSLDTSLFTMNLAAKLSQLIGDPSQPGLQTIQLTNQVTLVPGETVMLKGQIPADGWLPDLKDLPEGPHELLVFVTPYLIDAAGNNLAPSNTDRPVE